MSDNTSASDTGSQQENQDNTTERTYTQKEFDDHMARLKGSVAKKYEKVLSELGDLDELRSIKQDYEKRKLDEQKKRGEFETILKNLADSKDQEIRKRDEVIRSYTVDMPLVNTAAELGAVNPAQVKTLLKPYLRLNDVGEVEVLDDKGTVRYNDKGLPFGVKDLVKEFLDTNAHFRAAGPSTSQGKSNLGNVPEKLDPTKLNLKDPKQRALYRELRQGRTQ